MILALIFILQNVSSLYLPPMAWLAWTFSFLSSHLELAISFRAFDFPTSENKVNLDYRMIYQILCQSQHVDTRGSYPSSFQRIWIWHHSWARVRLRPWHDSNDMGAEEVSRYTYFD